VIDAALPGAFALGSAIWLSVTVARYYLKHNAAYEPLIKSATPTSYGALDSSSQTSNDVDEDEEDGESEDTLVSNLENQKSFTMFDAARFLAMLMAGLSIYNLVLVINGRYQADERAESDRLALLVRYGVSTMVWVRISDGFIAIHGYTICGYLPFMFSDNRLIQPCWLL
jgi:hypothetical protein